MELLPLLALTLLAVLGATAGVVVAVRSGGKPRAAAASPTGQEQGLRRLTGEIHTGWEQTLIALVRELQLPRSPSDIGYGALYLEHATEHRMYVRTRSEIGRGFLSTIDIVPRRGPTHVTYAILRLPGDELLHSRALNFELDLVTALRRIDPNANIHLAADALREFDRPRTRS